MNSRYLFLLCGMLLSSVATKLLAQSSVITSPDKKIAVKVWLNKADELRYSVTYQNKSVVKESMLGLRTTRDNFMQGLTLASVSATEIAKDQYELYTGKKTIVSYTANKKTWHIHNADGKKLDLIFQVANDGIAFRYFIPQTDNMDRQLITEELTTYHFDTSTKAFLQPMQVSKSGWEQTNPAYEEHYKQNIPVTDTAPTKAGWVYPALFQTKNAWVLITEAAVDTNNCATRLQASSPDGEYRVGFPDAREIKTGGGTLSFYTHSFFSPWRIITIGSLKTIVESTLGTDVAKPAIKFDQSFIKPGKSSWSWIMSKDDSIVYNEQIRYIDFAAKMNWQYTLVDAAWDKKIGYDKMAELSKYAATKNVGLLLWYNSAGDWNTVKYTPKGKLLTYEDRMKEFARLKSMDIKGVKIDFFGGDGQSVMQYYIDILKDAAEIGLMVNFHGATLPRGWQRTYPNLVTTEAVRGFEMITFNQSDADAEANHCAMLPFTRNAFDPMDFTPMNLYKIQTRVKRKTSSAFELATSVLFYSGIQHFAESPAGMSHVPEAVQHFLRDLPNRWDETKFIDGYPGKYIVLARRAGNKWYIAGINADAAERKMQIDVGIFKQNKMTFISDDKDALSFVWQKANINKFKKKSISIKPSGGFVMVLE